MKVEREKKENGGGHAQEKEDGWHGSRVEGWRQRIAKGSERCARTNGGTGGVPVFTVSASMAQKSNSAFEGSEREQSEKQGVT